jgi:hypothetical protein
VATRHDLAGLERRMDLRLERVEERIKAAMFELRSTFEHELRAQTTTMVFAVVGAVGTMAVLAFALARFS